MNSVSIKTKTCTLTWKNQAEIQETENECTNLVTPTLCFYLKVSAGFNKFDLRLFKIFLSPL